MLFAFLGFILTSIWAALFLGYKITQDVFPNGLKKFLNRIALRNWQKILPNKFGQYTAQNPKTTSETGIIVCPKETALEELVKLQGPNDHDELEFYAIDDKGNGCVVKMRRSYAGIVTATLYLTVDGNQYSVSRTGRSSSSFEFTLGNFKLEMVEPMRIWRIWYNGPLECNKDGDAVHAVINFLWKPLGSPMDSKKDANLELLSQYFTKRSLFGANFVDLPRILPDGYTQFGAQHGTIKIDEQELPPLYLYGFRTRTFTSSVVTNCEAAAQENNCHYELYGMSGRDGNVFCISGLHDGWTDGHIHYASDAQTEILSVDFEPELLRRNHTLPKLFTVNDKTKSFLVQIWPKFQTQAFPEFEVVMLSLSINGSEGRGILLRRKLNNFVSTKPSQVDSEMMSPLSRPNLRTSMSIDTFYDSLKERTTGLTEDIPEIVSFDSELALSVALVGGKGASLARLERGRNSEYKTARGFCVTTALFTSSLDMEKIRTIFLDAAENELDAACSDVMTLVRSSTENAHHISTLIPSCIHKVFGDSTSSNALRFAVRSSGVLEDADDLSCAGQNETFLGVLTHEIPMKLFECWASLFTPQSVRYRLNHGQPAVSEMAVVVQEMIQPHAAGVIFTADPRTGNPFEIIINGNYGLGESVVSAACDPDTITLLRPRSMNSEKSESFGLSIGKKVLGEKKSKIVQVEQGSTSEVSMTPEESQRFCLSDELSLKLGKVALGIEMRSKEFRPVDIEWAVDHGGNIYILQSRNITSLDAWTDFELIHEFDSPLRTMFERITDANTGEVMPGASSPLGLSVVARTLDITIQPRIRLSAKNTATLMPYRCKSTHIGRHRFLLNVLNTFYRNNEPEINSAQIATDISIFGHRVIDEEIHKISVERFGLMSRLASLKELLAVIHEVYSSEKSVKNATAKFLNYQMFKNLDSLGDSQEIYKRITERIFDIYEMCVFHTGTSVVSSVTQMFAFLTLANGRKGEDWDSDLYEDISQVLSVCMDVESADLPSAMNELAITIVKHGGDTKSIQSDFSEKSPKEAFDWLRNNSKSVIQDELDKFFAKHGHRCIAELDLMRKSWKTDPIPFVTLLQSLVRNKVKFEDSRSSSGPKSSHSNVETLLANLKTPISSSGKRFLKFLLPYCRNGVWNREKTKSLLVWTADQLKHAYDHLAHIMVKEHLIPSERLLYFMTHGEIGSLLNRHPTGSRILYKAMRRSKLHAELSKEQFPEITIGLPVPTDQSIQLELGDSIQATSVSSGKVQAKVKVCRTIEEASSMIEPGDILVTHGTDIGWSPFFPILGGIVTELGGLISHGAVVAREYGLPCIVGAANATKIFKTGEEVILDAGKGTLTKVKVQCDEK